MELRLIKNRSIYTAIEPVFRCSYLGHLVHVLEERINSDKRVVFHMTELRKEVGEGCIGCGSVVASALQKHIVGYEQLLDIWTQVLNDQCPGFMWETDAVDGRDTQWMTPRGEICPSVLVKCVCACIQA